MARSRTAGESTEERTCTVGGLDRVASSIWCHDLAAPAVEQQNSRGRLQGEIWQHQARQCAPAGRELECFNALGGDVLWSCNCLGGGVFHWVHWSMVNTKTHCFP